MEKQNLYIFNFSTFLARILILLTLIGLPISFLFEELIIYRTETNGAYKIKRILSNDIANEIPIFGSSRAEANFVPSLIYEDNCFNYGMSGTGANVWLFFLEKEINKKKKTPIIINYDLGGLKYADGNLSNYIPNWKTTKDILNTEEIYRYNLSFFKYFGYYEYYLKLFLNERFNVTKGNDNGGNFEENVLTISKFEDLVKKRKNTAYSFTNNKQLLSKFTNLINSTERTIVLVISPYHISCFDSTQNIDEENNLLKELDLKGNVELIDFRNLISEDSLFFDTTHLTYNGAKIFSKKLKEALLQRNIIN